MWEIGQVSLASDEETEGGTVYRGCPGTVSLCGPLTTAPGEVIGSVNLRKAKQDVRGTSRGFKLWLFCCFTRAGFLIGVLSPPGSLWVELVVLNLGFMGKMLGSEKNS